MVCRSFKRSIEMKDLGQFAGIDGSVGEQIHQRLHQFGPAAMDRRIPQPLPGVGIMNFGIEKQIEPVLKRVDRGDARRAISATRSGHLVAIES